MKDIETIRKDCNLTQNEMAQELGMSKRSYINKIDGESGWTLSELVNISKLCDDEIELKVGIDTYGIKITKIKC